MAVAVAVAGAGAGEEVFVGLEDIGGRSGGWAALGLRFPAPDNAQGVPLYAEGRLLQPRLLGYFFLSLPASSRYFFLAKRQVLRAFWSALAEFLRLVQSPSVGLRVSFCSGLKIVHITSSLPASSDQIAFKEPSQLF